MSCLKQAIGFIQAEHDRDLSLEETANQVGLSKFYFEREFRKVTGYSFVSYVNTVRCERAKALLSQSEQKTGVIGKVCGFSNPSYFISVFKKIRVLRPPNTV